jgi:hypothetical protein
MSASKCLFFDAMWTNHEIRATEPWPSGGQLIRKLYEAYQLLLAVMFHNIRTANMDVAAKLKCQH